MATESGLTGADKLSSAIHLHVTDAASGALTTCRIHLTDIDGERVRGTAFPFWHDHFTMPPDAVVPIAPGRYHYAIERGPEYRPVNGVIDVPNAGTAELRAAIERFVDMPSKGWWPGDLHVHRSLTDIELLMRAEDLAIAPVITWWNTKNVWSASSIPSQTVVQFDGNRFYEVMGGEDERNGGAFLYFGGTQPVDLSKCDKEWPSPMALLTTAAQSNPKPWIDIEKPFWWDVPVALAHGYGDSIGIANNHMCRGSMYASEAWGKPRDNARLPAPRGNGYWSQEIYYDILNCGIRIPPSAGSASGVLPNPVGYNRVYVHMDGPLTWAKWWDGLRAGRSFVTNGPMLLARANGELPGHVFTSNGRLIIALTADIVTQDPITWIEIVHDGAIVRRIPFEQWQRTGGLGTLQFDESGWLVIRTITDNPTTFRFASTSPFYVEIGRRKHRVSRTSAQFFLAWVRERKARIRHDDPAKFSEVLRFHEAAERYWQRVLSDATAP